MVGQNINYLNNMLSPDLIQKNNFSFKNKAYIASGFFNPEQLSIVSSIEDMLEEAEVEYYSPRKCGLNIMSHDKLDDKNLEFSFKRSLCNLNNLEIMKICDLGIVNLCGKEDIGTLFEYGYMLYAMLNYEGINVITLSDKKVFNLEVTEVIDKYSKLRGNCKGVDDSEYLGSTNNGKVIQLDCENDSDESEIDALVRMMIKCYTTPFNINDRYVVNIGTSVNWRAGIVMTGYLCRRLGSPSKLHRTSFISPFISKSNLMLTESLIQYKSLEDFNNDIPVKYNPEDIR